MNKTEIVEKLKQSIIEDLDLEDINIEELHEDTPLFGDGLGLDSIDAVEIVVLVEKYFNVTIKDAEEASKAFKSIGVLADFILEHIPG